MSEPEQQARRWLEEDPDPTTRAELQDVLDRGDEKALGEMFGRRLEFGTAGLRGVIGAGPNRMNRALVRRVTAGLARYLLEQREDVRQKGVVVGHDARRLSPEFAEDVARVLAGAGIPVHLFDALAPTPLVAYAVRALGAGAGVVITASHNPPEYNGYKVYWSNGAQIIPPHDEGISTAIDGVGSLEEVRLAPLRAAREDGRIRSVSQDVEEGYLRAILALQRRPEVDRDLEVVYTPLHGVGGRWVEEALTRSGVRALHRVVAQSEPDGEFPTVRFPNPEEEGAMDLSFERARETKADLVLANDPDADRLAVAVPVDAERTQYRMLSGNEVGCLLGHYLLTENLPDGIQPLVMTTIVSSRQLSVMAADLGANYEETLTGFKWIANRSEVLAREQGWSLVMGYEEALGYTVGTVVGDKDGVSAALLLTEIASVAKSRGTDLRGLLESMARRYGLFLSHQHSIVLPGSEGAAKIEALMDRFRAEPPTVLGRTEVIRVTDLAEGHGDLPASNVLAYDLEGGGRVLLRPSGTEPKIKFYFELSEPLDEDEALAEARARVEERMRDLVEDLLSGVEE